MPQLTQAIINVLNNYVQASPGATIQVATLPDGYMPDNVSCWKWALFGLLDNINYNQQNTSTIIHRPANAFDTILLGINPDPASYWSQEEILQTLMQAHQYVNQFQPYALHSQDDWVNWRQFREQAMTWVCNNICTGLGYIQPNQPPNYKLVMHYDDAGEDGIPYGPNETHWWIEVPLQNGNYVCIETFPQPSDVKPTLQFRFNQRYADFGNITTLLSDLNEAHVDLLSYFVNNGQ
ncbi:hypothetical protein KHS38_10105 [Mucilaginibacter sp. Bleaf8]|uniref:hypothetical protein n=1 Tax=Mucilaginibacter sp. Bleaf8 TaxID=2834430 RepID=UPI001BCE4429|nr:hypothetical protein [Mucilaginibacter sp. Bleaf8]MBS7564757.1 hypothetical protein [Mucilaginibacter sp. Bleaf8]